MGANLDQMLVTRLRALHGILSERFGVDIELHHHKLHNARWDLSQFRKWTMQQSQEKQVEREAEAVGCAAAGFHLEHVFRRQPEEPSQFFRGPFPSEDLEPSLREQIRCFTRLFFLFLFFHFHPFHLLLSSLPSSIGEARCFCRESCVLQTGTLHRCSDVLLTGGEIDPRRRESAMPKHPLDFGELRSGFEHAPRQAMAELVRRDGFELTRPRAELLCTLQITLAGGGVTKLGRSESPQVRNALACDPCFDSRNQWTPGYRALHPHE